MSNDSSNLPSTPRESAADGLMRIITADILILSILALFPWTNDPATPIKFLVIYCGVLLLSFLSLVKSGRSGESGPAGRWPLAFLMGMLVSYFVAALFSSHVANSLRAFCDFAVLAFLFLLVSRTRYSTENAWRLLAAVCVATALSSAYGFCQYFGWDPFPWSTTQVEEYRGLPATFANPNMASHTLNLALIMAVALATRKGTRWCAIPAILILAHIAMTGVRAAKVALVVVALLAATVIFLSRFQNRPLKAALLTCLVVAVFGIAGAGVGGIALKARTGSFVPLDRSVLLRYHSFYGAARMIADRPLLGYGPGNYQIDNPPYWTKYERDRFAVKPMLNTHVHNEYLEAAVEGGLIGALCFTGFLTASFLYALIMAFGAQDKDRRRLALTLAACIAGFAIDAVFGFNVHVPSSAALIFVLTGLVAAMVPRAKGNRVPRLPRLTAAAIVFGAAALTVVASLSFLGEVYYQSAEGAKYWKYLDQAYAMLGRAERFTPWNFRVPRQKAIVALEMKRPELAVEDMQRALKLHPNDVKGHIILSKAFSNMAVAALKSEKGGPVFEQAVNRAESAAKKALEYCPKLSDGHEMLGTCYHLRARAASTATPLSDEARSLWLRSQEELQAALESGSENRVKVNAMMAMASMALNDATQADRAMQRAAAANPTSEEMWRGYLEFAEEFGRWDSLIASLGDALKRLEQDKTTESQARATLMLRLAEALYRGKKDAAQARDVLTHTLEIAPQRLDVWGAYAFLLEPESRVKALQALLEQKLAEAASRGMEMPPVLTIVTKALQKGAPVLLECADSIRKLCQEAKLEPAERQRQYGWAVGILAQVVQGSSLPDLDKGRALYALGFAYLTIEAWSHADATLAQAAELLPPSEKASCSAYRSEALFRLGRVPEALDVARGAAAALPTTLSVRRQYARILAQAGRQEDAQTEYLAIINGFKLEPAQREAIEAEMKSVLGKKN